MPIILPTERRNFKARVLIGGIYLLLMLGGVTMVYPFLMTVTASLSGPMDYTRFSVLPRSLYSRADRLVRSFTHMPGPRAGSIPFASKVFFPDVPDHWTTWQALGDDTNGIDHFAAQCLAVEQDSAKLEQWRAMARDFAGFALDYDIRDTVCMHSPCDLPNFLEAEYIKRYQALHPNEAARMSSTALRGAALALLCDEWGVTYAEFYDISMEEAWVPLQHVSWMYPKQKKYEAWERIKSAYQRMIFRPKTEKQWRAFMAGRGQSEGIPWPVTPTHGAMWPQFKEFIGTQCPALQTVPYALKNLWVEYLDRESTKEALGMSAAAHFKVEDYNRVFGASCASLHDVPFPVPADVPQKLKELWVDFQKSVYPRRLIEVRITPALEKQYQDIFRRNCKDNIATYNELTGSKLKSFEEIRLEARGTTEDWIKFVNGLTPENLIFYSAEAGYQRYLIGKYGNIAAINAAYGWKLSRIEEAEMPLVEAHLVNYLNNEWSDYSADLQDNYRFVIDFLFRRGRAFVNTIVLCLLTILVTLTVNPLCAYALSRYRLRFTEQILLFLLATMAFPGAVRAIPGFLLMKDLGLLNSYSALILPGLASGISIFILKGFFDGLPRELYEAASLDGATEFQMFRMITLPLCTPILAVNALGAFIASYNSWDWALLVCQKREYWTLAVWLYQVQQAWVNTPYVIMAGFVLASIPTAIIFIICQKIILRGIVIPAMK